MGRRRGVILADTSAWIEYFRDSGTQLQRRLADLVAVDEALTTDVVMMEVLGGARGRRHRQDLLEALFSVHHSSVRAPADYLQAADLYATCRRNGEAVRQFACLIAAVAIRNGVPVLTADADFEVLARHTGLELA